MAVNFTAADRVGVVGGYIGGIGQLLGCFRVSPEARRRPRRCAARTRP